MELKILSREKFLPFLDRMMKDLEVVGVKKKNGEDKYFFHRLESPTEICLDYDVTILPPKKYFLPQREPLIRFKMDKEPFVEPIVKSLFRVIFGVHPYDIAAINLLDKVFSQEKPDLNYLKKRQDTLIVGINVKKPSPYAFYQGIGTGTVEKGFDLFFTDLGENYGVEIASKKGENLLRYGDFREAKKEQIAKLKDIKEKEKKSYGQRMLKVPVENLPQLLEKKFDHHFWEENAKKCLSCGSCNLVCPTCYCFDVQDEVNLSLTSGERFRQWDGCLLTDFARVATGENFMEDRVLRYKHRFFRKGKYIPERFGMVGCVGCGRCASSCLADIADPVEVYNRLFP
jgi:ferredoxin